MAVRVTRRARNRTDLPGGTVGRTASHSNDQGVEVSDVLVATTKQVSGFFDNFNNIDEPNNFVIAICAAAESVNDPSGFTPKVMTR